MWLPRYYTYVFYLVLERINQQLKKFEIEKLNDAMFWLLGLYHMLFVPYLMSEVLQWLFPSYHDWFPSLGRKDFGVIIAAIMVLTQHFIFFHNQRWVRQVKRCKQDEKPTRRRRTWITGIYIACIFIGTLAHFVAGVPRK